jgi:hypothetical protein
MLPPHASPSGHFPGNSALSIIRTGSKEIKTGSSKWVHEVDPKSSEFRWQTGYGIFSVDPDKKSIVIQYIQSQEEHHRIVSFQEEYRRFLDQYELSFDERYIWD